jgi:hypothetical protein
MLSTAILIATLVVASEAQNQGTTNDRATTTTVKVGGVTTSRNDAATTSTSRTEGTTTTTSRNDGPTTTSGRVEATTSTSRNDQATTTPSKDTTASTTRTTTTTGRNGEITTTAGRDDGPTTTSKTPEATTTGRVGEATTTGRNDGPTTTSKVSDATSTNRNGEATTRTTTTTKGDDRTTTWNDTARSTTSTRYDDKTTTRSGEERTTTKGGEDRTTTTSKGNDERTTTKGGDDRTTTTSKVGEDRTTTKGGDNGRTTAKPTQPPTRPQVDDKREEYREAVDAATKCRLLGGAAAECNSDVADKRQEYEDAAKKVNDERAATRTDDRQRVNDLARDINASKTPETITPLCKPFTDNVAACANKCDFANVDPTQYPARLSAAVRCVADEKDKELRDAGNSVSKEIKDQTRTEIKNSVQADLACLPAPRLQAAQKSIDATSTAEEDRNERQIKLVEINAKVAEARAKADDTSASTAVRDEARKTLREVNADAAKQDAVRRLPGKRRELCATLIDGVAAKEATNAGETDKRKFVGGARVLHIKVELSDDKIETVRNKLRTSVDEKSELEKSDSVKLVAPATKDASKKRGSASCEAFVPVNEEDFDIASTKVATIVAESDGTVTSVASIGQADVDAAQEVKVEVDSVDGAASLALGVAMVFVSIAAALL